MVDPAVFLGKSLGEGAGAMYMGNYEEAGNFHGQAATFAAQLYTSQKLAEVISGKPAPTVDELWQGVKNLYKEARAGGAGAAAGTTFSKGSAVPDDVLQTKPKYSPVADKWLEKGGKITIENGEWKYTNSQGTSVTYKNGYPDFKGSGHVKQEVDIGEFNNRAADFKKANKLSGGLKDPVNNMWHHLENGKTLQEVNASIHRQFNHQGGISVMKRGN